MILFQDNIRKADLLSRSVLWIPSGWVQKRTEKKRRIISMFSASEISEICIACQSNSCRNRLPLIKSLLNYSGYFPHSRAFRFFTVTVLPLYIASDSRLHRYVRPRYSRDSCRGRLRCASTYCALNISNWFRFFSKTMTAISFRSGKKLMSWDVDDSNDHSCKSRAKEGRTYFKQQLRTMKCGPLQCTASPKREIRKALKQRDLGLDWYPCARIEYVIKPHPSRRSRSTVVNVTDGIRISTRTEGHVRINILGGESIPPNYIF